MTKPREAGQEGEKRSAGWSRMERDRARWRERGGEQDRGNGAGTAEAVAGGEGAGAGTAEAVAAVTAALAAIGRHFEAWG